MASERSEFKEELLVLEMEWWWWLWNTLADNLYTALYSTST
jgi:hypothetical protein